MSSFSTSPLLHLVSFLRMTKALTEADGPSWREKLPPIPAVPLAVREKLVQKAAAPQPKPADQQNGVKKTSRPGTDTHAFTQETPGWRVSNGSLTGPWFPSAPSDKDLKRSQVLKEEGNALVKKGEQKKAIDKYSQSLKLNPTEATTYTNR